MQGGKTSKWEFVITAFGATKSKALIFWIQKNGRTTKFCVYPDYVSDYESCLSSYLRDVEQFDEDIRTEMHNTKTHYTILLLMCFITKSLRVYITMCITSMQN